jgi:hypothetical protein
VARNQQGRMSGAFQRMFSAILKAIGVRDDMPREGGQTGMVRVPAEPEVNEIRAEEFERFVLRRDAHLRSMAYDPAARVPSGAHASLGIFEAWLDGSISDQSIEIYMRDHNDCESCKRSYEYYRMRKAALR